MINRKAHQSLLFLINTDLKAKSIRNGISVFICLFITVIGLSLTKSQIVLASSDDQKVYDYYGLFSQEEVTELENTALEYGEEGKIDIVIVTIDQLAGETRQKYLEDFYDEYGFGYDKEFGDAVLLLINMDPNDRGVEIQGYGNAEYYINNDRIELILDDITPMLADGNYYDAMVEYAKQAAYYMNQTEGVNTTPSTGTESSGNDSSGNDSSYSGSSNYNNGSSYSGSNNYSGSSYSGTSNYYAEENIFYNTFFQLVIALVIGGVSVGVMAYRSGGRITVNNRTYLDQQHSGIVARQDDYIRTTVTRTKKPSNNNNSGSGGGGVSSGGHSHSGGGRSF